MDLIGVDEVASMIGVSASTVRWWRQTGKGPRSARIGKHVRYRLTDVEMWIESLFDSDPERLSKSVEYEFKALGRGRIARLDHD